MEYIYTKSSTINLDLLQDNIINSNMENKTLIWCRWDEEIEQLRISFFMNLTPLDKEKLDGIVQCF
jgi:hypothetical protein